MEKIQHKYVDVRGLKLHVAEIGTGPVVVFLHGFPEIWYSWRYQMIAVANAGFRAIAPDFRGYGLSQQPDEPEKTTFRDLVDDLLATMDLFDIPKAFIVGKDFGAKSAHQFALLHPDRTIAVATLGVPFLPSAPQAIDWNLLPAGFYVLRWQEPGRAEKDFGRFDIKTVVRNIYILFSGSELPVAKEDQEIMDLVDPSAPLPSWFIEEDLAAYASLYENNGFRSLAEDYGTDEEKIKVPSLLIMGEKDYALIIGLGEFVKSGMVKEYVPDLEIIYLPEGGHFVQEQLPEQEINERPQTQLSLRDTLKMLSENGPKYLTLPRPYHGLPDEAVLALAAVLRTVTLSIVTLDSPDMYEVERMTFVARLRKEDEEIHIVVEAKVYGIG